MDCRHHSSWEEVCPDTTVVEGSDFFFYDDSRFSRFPISFDLSSSTVVVSRNGPVETRLPTGPTERRTDP